MEEASIAAFVAEEDVTFVKEEMREGETDDGFGEAGFGALLPDESTDSQPELRVR